jgi:hypothetical protein
MRILTPSRDVNQILDDWAGEIERVNGFRF